MSLLPSPNGASLAVSQDRLLGKIAKIDEAITQIDRGAPNLRALNECSDDISNARFVSGVPNNAQLQALYDVTIRLAASAGRGAALTTGCDSDSFRALQIDSLRKASVENDQLNANTVHRNIALPANELRKVLARYHTVADAQVNAGDDTGSAQTIARARRLILSEGALQEHFSLDLNPKADDLLKKGEILFSFATEFSQHSRSPEIRRELQKLYTEIAGNITSRLDARVREKYTLDAFAEDPAKVTTEKEAALKLHGGALRSLAKILDEQDVEGARRVFDLARTADQLFGYGCNACKYTEFFSDLSYCAEEAAKKLLENSLDRERLEKFSLDVSRRLVDLGAVETLQHSQNIHAGLALSMAINRVHNAAMAPLRIREQLVTYALHDSRLPLAGSDNPHPINSVTETESARLVYAWHQMAEVPGLCQKYPRIGNLAKEGAAAILARRVSEKI